MFDFMIKHNINKLFFITILFLRKICLYSVNYGFNLKLYIGYMKQNTYLSKNIIFFILFFLLIFILI